jgi:hypothetical protein
MYQKRLGVMATVRIDKPPSYYRTLKWERLFFAAQVQAVGQFRLTNTIDDAVIPAAAVVSNIADVDKISFAVGTGSACDIFPIHGLRPGNLEYCLTISVLGDRVHKRSISGIVMNPENVLIPLAVSPGDVYSRRFVV